MAPEGVLELQLAQRIATDSWRLNRISAIEDNLFALGLNEHAGEIQTEHPEVHSALVAARTFRAEAKHLQLLSLYEQRINRTLQKNLATLRQIQAERKAQSQTEIAKVPQPERSAQAGANGFVFSNNKSSTAQPLSAPLVEFGVERMEIEQRESAAPGGR